MRSLIIAGVLLLTSCGYYNPGLLSDNAGEKITLAVPIWDNRTNELGLENRIHNALHDWLGQSNRLQIADSTASASHELTGTIISVTYPGLSYDATDQARSLKAKLTMRYSLLEKETGLVLLERERQVFEQSYTTGTSSAQTNANKRKALEIIADDLAEHLYIRIFQKLSAPAPGMKPIAENGVTNHTHQP